MVIGSQFFITSTWVLICYFKRFSTLEVSFIFECDVNKNVQIHVYDCSYIMRANTKYEVVNGCKCTLLRGAILLLQVNPEFVECFKPE